jgi:hypothetical protein
MMTYLAFEPEIGQQTISQQPPAINLNQLVGG